MSGLTPAQRDRIRAAQQARWKKRRGAEQAAEAKPSASAASHREITLRDLDVLPPMKPVALKDLTVPQLAEAYRGLNAAEEHYEKLSGICATMKGIVLCEAKAKIPHGGFLKWLEATFPKTRKTAAQYMRLAGEFGKNNPKVTFAALQTDLLATLEAAKGAELDLAHPLVSKVADWVKGRSAYQLLLDLGSHRAGGKTYERDGEKGKREQLTAEEAEELLKTICTNGAEHLAAIHKEHAFIVLNDAELDGLVDHCTQVLEDVRAWRKLSKAERKESLGAAVAALTAPPAAEKSGAGRAKKKGARK